MSAVYLSAARDYYASSSGAGEGLGHAVLCAHPVVGDEPVAVFCLTLFWMNMNPICHRITWRDDPPL